MTAQRLQHYIYKITCLETGEYYVGKRTAPDWKTDPYMGSGYLLNKKMKAHPEYTWTKEVLMLFRSAEEAYKWEKIAIGNRFRGGSEYDGLCLNMVEGGSGSGLSEEDCIRRKELTDRLILGEDLGITAIRLSNDALQRRIEIANTPRGLDIARQLIESGWYVGTTESYKRIGFAELGLLKSDIYTAAFERGEIPEGVSLFVFSNHELRQRVNVHASNRILEVAQRLLAQGWICKEMEDYDLVNLTTLKLTTIDLLEEAFIEGRPCPVSGFEMHLKEKGIYVHINQPKKKKHYPFHKYTEILYKNGWRFGALPRSTSRSINIEEALKTTN